MTKLDVRNASVDEIKTKIKKLGGAFCCYPSDPGLLRLYAAVRDLAYDEGYHDGIKRGKSIGSQATYNKFVKGGVKND